MMEGFSSVDNWGYVKEYKLTKSELLVEEIIVQLRNIQDGEANGNVKNNETYIMFLEKLLTSAYDEGRQWCD